MNPQSTLPTIFVSYSRKDIKWRGRLRTHLESLEHEGIAACWDDSCIQPGMRWKKEIEDAIRSAKIGVVLVSANYFSSKFVARVELPSLLEAAKNGDITILPVILSPSRFEKDPRLNQFQTVNLPDEPLAKLTEVDQEKVLVRLTDSIEDLLSHPRTPGEETGANRPMLWDIPVQRNRYFTGREDVLTKLERILASEGKAALTGIGGVGKTQIAAEYAYQNECEYTSVLWIYADTQQAVLSSFTNIATLLDLPDKNSGMQHLIVHAVFQWLRTQERVLLIIDNADDLSLVAKFIPLNIRGHVVLTTQARVTSAVSRSIRVEPLTSRDSVLFLLRRSNIESVDDECARSAVSVTKELGRIPLAIDQAGAFVEEHDVTLEEYLSLYRNEGKRLRGTRGESPTDANLHPNSVTITVLMAFRKVVASSPSAADLLRACAFLYPDQIPEELFKDSGSSFSEILGFAASNQLQWTLTIKEACRLSILARNADLKILSVHRLVQEVIKDQLEKEQQKEWAHRAVCAMNKAFPSAAYENWSKCERYVKQIQSCVELVVDWDLCSLDAAQFLNKTGVYYHHQCRYREAAYNYERAVEIWTSVLGGENKRVIAGISNLALVYHHQGQYQKAVEEYCRALALQKKVLGDNCAELSINYNNLAELYREWGCLREAERDHQKALSIKESAFGSNHPHVAKTLNNLALTYWKMEQYEKAEQHYLRCLTIQEGQLPSNHPDLATSICNLGALYVDLGRLEDAEIYLNRAFDIRIEVFGDDHRDVANSLKHLGKLSLAQNRYDKAERFFKRSLKIAEEMLGVYHPEIADILEPFSLVLEKKGRKKEAEAAKERARDIRKLVTEDIKDA